MKSLSLAIIAICYIANTVAVYESDNGGKNVYFGNFGYHFEKAN
jgi:hypothetical protein